MRSQTAFTPARQSLTLAAALWMVVVAGWLGLLGLEALATDSLACELVPGSSIYGDAAWSWLPPGRICSWTLTLAGAEPVTVVQRPPAARAGIAVVLILWGTSLRMIASRRHA